MLLNGKFMNIEEVQWKSPPPMSLGSKIAFVAKFLGRRLDYTYEIVDLQPTGSLHGH
jgi:hypothetical protein